MATEGFTASKSTHGKTRCSCLLSSCFGASSLAAGTKEEEEEEVSVSSSATPETKKALQSRRWKFTEKKKTVPVREEESPPPVVTTRAVPLMEKSKHVKSSFFHWFQIKHWDKRIKSTMSTNHNQYQPQHPSAGAHPNSEAQNFRVHHVMSRCKTRLEPTPLCRMQDQTQTGTRTSHPGSPEHTRHAGATSTRTYQSSLHKKSSTQTGEGIGEFGSLFGLSVITVVLAMLLLCGRACTIICICAWFYFSSRIKATSTVKNTKIGEVEIDMNSKEYKKMVVLRGLLERDRRRPSLTKLAGVH